VGQDLFGSLHPFSPHRLWLVLINLASMLFFIAIIWRMHCVIRNVHEPLIQDFRIGLNKVVYVFVATIIISAVLFAITMLIFGFEILLHHYDLLFSQHPFGLILTLIVFVGQMLLILYVFTLFFFFIPLIAIENKRHFFILRVEYTPRLEPLVAGFLITNDTMGMLLSTHLYHENCFRY